MDTSSESSSEQDKKVLEPDENSEQEKKPGKSPEQDKKALEPDEDSERRKKPDMISDLGLNLSSEDFIELELCEDAEDSTTAKEQEGNNSDDEALPTQRRKGKWISRQSLDQNQKEPEMYQSR